MKNLEKMKVRLKKDWLGYKAGKEFELGEDGYITFRYGNDDVLENYTVSSSTTLTVNKAWISDNLDTFEYVVEKEPEQSIEEGPFKLKTREEIFKLKTREEIEAKLSSIYSDRDILKSIDYKYASKYIHMLDNMAYMLEWTLGKVE